MEVADGICSGCAWQFAQHASRSNGAAAAAPQSDAVDAAPQVHSDVNNGTPGRSAARIAPYVPAPSGGSAPGHRCAQMDLLQCDLDHTRALLAEVERQRDYLLAELEAARHRLDAGAEERSEILQLVNFLLKHRAPTSALITPWLDLPALERGHRGNLDHGR
jgi:hypothetical protein